MQKVTILTKIKFKAILFENIQGFVGIRHYILPYLINNDKVLQNKLKIFNSILKDNKLSSNFINNFYTFISDRILFRIVNEDKNLMDDSQYFPEEGINKFQTLKKRILNYFKSRKYHNDTNISINDLKKYLPNEREFALFLFDFLENKNQILSVFTSYNLGEKNNINKFLLYYEKNKDKEKINQITNNEIESFYGKMNRKVLINLAFIGNVNVGKSTTIGHLLYSLGKVDQNYFRELLNSLDRKYMSSSVFSWLTYSYMEERYYDRTYLYHIKKIETTKYDFNLIDLPSNFHYAKNLMKGISLADAAVILISGKDQYYLNDHTKDYLFIIYSMGIRQIIIAVNKMDQTGEFYFYETNYSERIFLEIKKNMIDLCEKIGFISDNIQFIAYSGLTGQNLVNRYEDEDSTKSNKMDWYKGKTLLESFDEIKPPKRILDEPLKIAIYTIKYAFEGKILSGKLKTNMKICLPIKRIDKILETECESIEIHNHPFNEAIAGDIIGFNLKRIKHKKYIKCNLVFNENILDCIKFAYNLRVKILMINEKIKLRICSDLVLFSYTLYAPIKIAKIEYLVDEANKILEKEPEEIKNGEYAIIIINLNEKCLSSENRTYYIFEKYNKNSFLGSVVLFNGEFIAVGKIIDINV